MDFGGNLKTVSTFVTQTARLILRKKVDFARQQPDRNPKNRAATVDSCFVLIGTRQDKTMLKTHSIRTKELSTDAALFCRFSVGLLPRKVNFFT